MDIWSCKIGPTDVDLPLGADSPLRQAVQKAFLELTGHEAEVCFSGWGSKFTEGQMEILIGERAAKDKQPSEDLG